jgi:acyl CoA:acetate/3-ketoacid CoA transferase
MAKKAKARIWCGNFLVEYVDVDMNQCSFMVKTLKDLKKLIQELKEAGYSDC